MPWKRSWGSYLYIGIGLKKKGQILIRPIWNPRVVTLLFIWNINVFNHEILFILVYFGMVKPPPPKSVLKTNNECSISQSNWLLVLKVNEWLRFLTIILYYELQSTLLFMCVILYLDWFLFDVKKCSDSLAKSKTDSIKAKLMKESKHPLRHIII